MVESGRLLSGYAALKPHPGFESRSLRHFRDVGRSPQVREIVGVLGYPEYFLVILGVWKILGAATLLAPRLPRVKEWAYAGAMFTYTGAIASHLAVGDGRTGEIAILSVMAVLAVVSWTLRPPARREVPRGR